MNVLRTLVDERYSSIVPAGLCALTPWIWLLLVW
jgi:hypothetical protein